MKIDRAIFIASIPGRKADQKAFIDFDKLYPIQAYDEETWDGTYYVYLQLASKIEMNF